MLKIFGRLIGLKGEDLKYDSEILLFILAGIILFLFLGFFKAITKEDVLKLQAFLQSMPFGFKIDLSYWSNIAKFQNNNLYAVIYFCIAFFMSIDFLILRFVYGIKLSHEKTDTLNSQSNNFSDTKKA
ncbi:hypothetical protein [Clostridium sp. ZS2-4]|uniref:hypothetical protein n=1 Tax=Clostridium sp. ZS2-4 TaxID=2987703 RepID=UPI00227C11E3|nr:hypothetical protein [Clostridium sp. ZS2-4]MCY6355894.1 hypothetical protein [Clostridium sp. ZS2-4]